MPAQPACQPFMYQTLFTHREWAEASDVPPGPGQVQKIRCLGNLDYPKPGRNCKRLAYHWWSRIEHFPLKPRRDLWRDPLSRIDTLFLYLICPIGDPWRSADMV